MDPKEFERRLEQRVDRRHRKLLRRRRRMIWLGQAALALGFVFLAVVIFTVVLLLL